MKNKILTAISCHHAVYPVDDPASAHLRLGTEVSDSGNYDLLLRRLYDFFRYLFDPGLYRGRAKSKLMQGVCRHQQHLCGRRDCDHRYAVSILNPALLPDCAAFVILMLSAST